MSKRIRVITPEEEQELKGILAKNRPQLTSKSIDTYIVTLKQVIRHLVKPNEDGTYPPLDIKIFNDYEKVLKSLSHLPPNIRKTLLSSLFVLTNIEQYRDQMMKDIEEYNKMVAKQAVEPKLQESWMTPEDMENIYKTYEKLWNKAKRSKHHKSKKISEGEQTNFNDMMKYVVVALTCGKFIAPRRSKDWTHFKIRNINTETDNYLDSNTLVFNTYKTKKTYGKQIIPIPEELAKIIKKWSTVQTGDYLIKRNNGTMHDATSYNILLKSIYGPNISTNALRKLYLTNKYQETSKQFNKMAEDMSNMGSSTKQVNHYVKLDINL